MKYKILNVKKRNVWVRWYSANHWRVEVLYKGKKYKFNVWAGIDNPTSDKLCHDIVSKLKEMEKVEEKDIYKLVGKIYE